MSLFPSESNLNTGLPLNLMLEVLPLSMFQSHFEIPTHYLFFPCFFSFFLGFSFYASASTFLPLIYFGVLGYGDHEYSKKGGNFIKIVYNEGCLGLDGCRGCYCF